MTGRTAWCRCVWYFTALSVLCACAPCRHGSAATGRLSNRWHYTIRQQTDTELATASVRVRIGCNSKEDLDMAHLLEHVLLNDLRETDLPLHFYAETTPQEILFRCTFLPERLSDAISALTRMGGTSSYDERTIAGALHAIGHELRRPALPPAPDAEELRKFHLRHFVPDRIALDIATPLAPAEVIAKIEHQFSVPQQRLCKISGRGSEKYVSLSLTGKTMAVLSQKIGEPTATIAVFIPKYPFPAFDHHCLHHLFAQATRRRQGSMIWDDSPDYYAAATAVRKANFAGFLRQIVAGDFGSHESTLAHDTKAKAWQEMCAGVARRERFSSKTVILMSGDFPISVLLRSAISLHSFLLMSPHNGLQVSQPVAPDFPYVMAMVATEAPTDRLTWEMLAALLRRSLYQRLIVPGLAYRMGCHYQPMLGYGVLGVWVETTPRLSRKVRQAIIDAIAAARTPVSSTDMLAEKAGLYYLLQRDSPLKRDYHHCLDLGTRSFVGRFDPGQFRRRQEEYLDPHRWSFWVSPGSE